MKRIASGLILIFIGGFIVAQSKSIVVYFSRADENYSVGVIKKGNTEIVAEIIAETLQKIQQEDAEIFSVERATPYSAEYKKCCDEAKLEQIQNARPEIAASMDLTGYDTVYLGYPIYWGDLPMPLCTFIDQQNWNGKTVAPFCTHEGSGLSGTEAKLRAACKGATVKKGLAVRGASAQNNRAAAEKAVKEWLK